jgi:hypothetical protein
LRTPEEREDIHAALIACERALSGGHYREAERHLAHAAHLGASPQEVTRLGHAITEVHKAQNRRISSNYGKGLVLGFLGYLLLSVQQPLGWTLPLWILLAFLVIPGIVGVLIGSAHGPAQTAREIFRMGMKGAGWPMAFYTAVTLLILSPRLVRMENIGQEFLAGALVTLVYALLAGGVAGLASMMTAKRTAGRG